MSEIHIATDETFLHDAIEIESTCRICNVLSTIRIGWVGEKCDTCGYCVDPFEITMQQIVKLRRELLKISRKQMSEKTGYAPATIKQYEWVRCTKEYFDKTTEIINDHFNQPKPLPCSV